MMALKIQYVIEKNAEYFIQKYVWKKVFVVFVLRKYIYVAIYLLFTSKRTYKKAFIMKKNE